MDFVKKENSDQAARAMLIALLPGPNRRRSDALYQYRLVYRQPDLDADGCLMLWQVLGGRQPYQVALERDGRAQLRWHCTCPDAVYRGETLAGHTCKHVRGLLDFLPPLSRSASWAA